jgi:topoisomerase-4 subunit A
MKATTIAFVEDLLARYGSQFPRRTKLTRFRQIDKKAVSRKNVKLSYDPKSGLFGSEVKGSRFKLEVGELDLILGISDDGTYRVMTPQEKVFFPGKLLHCALFDPEKGFECTVVYRDGTRICYGKRVRIDRFIRNREYRLVKDENGKVMLFLPDGEEGIVSLQFVPAPRQRVKAARFDLSTLEPTGVAARGTRLASKPVKSLKLLARKVKRRPGGDAPAPPEGQTSLF